MAIKISSSTIIDDSRNIVNSNTVGIGTTNTVSLGTSTATSSSTSQVGIHSTLSSSTYRSVEYLIQATEGSNYQAEKLLVIHNGSTTYDTRYGNITNSSVIADYSSDISGGNIRLLTTPSSAGVTTYVISYTAIKI